METSDPFCLVVSDLQLRGVRRPGAALARRNSGAPWSDINCQSLS